MYKEDNEEEIVDSEESEPEDIYTIEGTEEELSNDEISTAEAGFMEGYDYGKILRCDYCNKEIDYELAVEREVNGVIRTFCSEECADKFCEEIEE